MFFVCILYILFSLYSFSFCCCAHFSKRQTMNMFCYLMLYCFRSIVNIDNCSTHTKIEKEREYTEKCVCDVCTFGRTMLQDDDASKYLLVGFALLLKRLMLLQQHQQQQSNRSKFLNGRLCSILYVSASHTHTMHG